VSALLIAGVFVLHVLIGHDVDGGGASHLVAAPVATASNAHSDLGSINQRTSDLGHTAQMVASPAGDAGSSTALCILFLVGSAGSIVLALVAVLRRRRVPSEASKVHVRSRLGVRGPPCRVAPIVLCVQRV
jgi:hypothetical protein